MVETELMHIVTKDPEGNFTRTSSNPDILETGKH